MAFLGIAACTKPETDNKEAEEQQQEPEEPEVEPRTECDLSIMSFNVAVDNLQDGKGWQSRKAGVHNMLSQAKPMVIGFQEAQAHEITYMINLHPEYKWYGLGRDTGNVPSSTTSYSAEEAMVIFWMKDSLDVMNKGTFWLSQTPDEPGKGWDAAYPRTLTWIEFKHKITSQRFYVFNTHLDHKGKTARTESMKLIASQMAVINSKNYPAFLTADFNTTASDAIFAPIKPKMTSTRDVAPDSDKTKMTYNGYTSAGKSQIDHIFFSGDKLTPLTFKVLDGDYGTTWVSDHYPIMATYHYGNQ